MRTIRELDLELAGGIRLAAAECGHRHGPVALLVHGYTDSWPSWRPLMNALPPSIRAIAVSLRGHGASAKPEGDYALATFAGDLAAVLDRLGIQSATVVGHSMGSLVGMRLAAAAPGRIDGLMLIGAIARTRDNPAVAALWAETVRHLRDPIDPGFVRAFQESCLARPVPSGLIDEAVTESLRVPAHVWRAALAAMLREDPCAVLRRVRAPTTIVWGDRDGFSDREEQAMLLQAHREAVFSVHEGAGHAPHWEDPRRVAAEIAALVARSQRIAA